MEYELDVLDEAIPGVASEVADLFRAAERDAFPKDESSRSLLKKQKPRPEDGPERGRLNRFYAAYANDKSDENLNQLLGEVELYARRNTLGKGDHPQYLSQSATTAYPHTEVSIRVAENVWQKLGTFKGDSKFSSWVFRIAKNVVKDADRQIYRRCEVELLDWKNYGEDESASRSGPGGQAPYVFDSSDDGDGGGHGWQPLVDHYRRDDPSDALSQEFNRLLQGLTDEDQKIIKMFRDGYRPADIGKTFGKNAKWVSNNLERIKATLRQQVDPTILVLEQGTKRDEQLTWMIEHGFDSQIISAELKRDIRWVRKQLKRLDLGEQAAANQADIKRQIEDVEAGKANKVVPNVLVLKENKQALPASEAAHSHPAGQITSAPPSF
jgi:RNA polymerase sigma factor (sigma-70 family)